MSLPFRICAHVLAAATAVVVVLFGGSPRQADGQSWSLPTVTEQSTPIQSGPAAQTVAYGGNGRQVVRLPQPGTHYSNGYAVSADVPHGVVPDLSQPHYGAGPGLHLPSVWSWQVLPTGLIYPAKLADPKEPRLGAAFNYDEQEGWAWDLSAGARVGLLRWGEEGTDFPNGWQLDVEGAAFPRLDLEHQNDLVATDFRFGLPLTYGAGPYQMKLAYLHISSHLGDEYIIQNGLGKRKPFSRDAFVWGHSWFFNPNWRVYFEIGYGFRSIVTEPWDFQLGLEYSPVCVCGPSNWSGAPFLAANTHLREEVDFGGHIVLQLGWQWRNYAGQRFRIGFQYYNGAHERYEFFDEFENKIAFALWYDF